ncbi:hypothetical protein MBLNU13_g11269t1 [Cladosporium sp. NU13]
MPLLDWFAELFKPLPQFYRESMDVRSSTSATEPPQTQTQSVPTLSFDLSAPTDPSSGWTVQKVWGADGDDSNDFAKQLQDILNRAETFSILNTLFYRHIVAVLVVVWSVVLWRKARAVGMRFGWWDGLAVVVCVASVLWRDMVLAIGGTAGYAAWAVLADRPWNGQGGLPDFETFVKGLKPAGEDQDRDQAGCRDAESIAQAEPGAEAEAALLTRIEANLGLLSEEPQEECIVCWSSDDSPLRLPCSHLVCSGCLTRLKDANEYTCPFCRRPLYTLSTNKVALFQLISFSSGAQLALALILTALRIARGRYWGAAECLVFKGYPAAGALWHQWGIRMQGEEGFFAGASERFLQIQLGLSVYLLKGIYGGLDEVGWVTFIDGKLVRAGVDEWRDLREVLCWAVPGLAGKVVDCSQRSG